MSDLTTVKIVEPAEWMVSEETNAVMSALNKGGMNALFVGGCVRNMLLGEEVTDIDIATKLKPEEVTQRLEGKGVKVVPTGIEHGTVTAVVEGQPFEITTLRHDVETDGRHAVVGFTDDWLEDAKRRDFTMNTLLADQAGNIYDPTGLGSSDLKTNRIVFVGKPSERIEEDYLRVLRFFRFHAYYGRGDMDVDALSACQDAAEHIPSLSKERITQEFFKILSAPDPASILSVMFEHGVLKALEFDGGLKLLSDLCQQQNKHNQGAVSARLTALASLKPSNIEAMQALLLIPKVFKKDIEAIHGVLNLPDLVDDHAIRVAVYKYGRIPTAQGLMIELAQGRARGRHAGEALDLIGGWDIPTFPVTGEALIKQGFQTGPALGAELERLEQEWIDGGFKAT